MPTCINNPSLELLVTFDSQTITMIGITVFSHRMIIFYTFLKAFCIWPFHRSGFSDM